MNLACPGLHNALNHLLLSGRTLSKVGKSMKNEPRLELRSVSKNYGNLNAVRQISFAIPPGEIFGLLGPNGAGKTTIISCVVTLETQSQGEIFVCGKNTLEEPVQAKKRFGFVPQELIHHGYFTVAEILRFQSGFYGIRKNREREEYLLRRCQLWDHKDKRVKQLSGGMKRRLLIAKALVHRPQLLLLDEPTAGVDIELRQVLWEFVRDLKKEGMSVLLTTHYLAEAEELCDRVGILNKGHLALIESTHGLIHRMTSRVIRVELKAGTPVTSTLLQHPAFLKQSQNEFEFRVPSSANIGSLFGEIDVPIQNVKDLQVREGSLEEAFLSVLETQGAKT